MVHYKVRAGCRDMLNYSVQARVRSVVLILRGISYGLFKNAEPVGKFISFHVLIGTSQLQHTTEST